nr:hypothetical protein [Planococcus glaciei]
MGAAVEVRFADGETIKKQTDFPKGDPENAVTAEELRDKFLAMTGKYPSGQRQQLADDLLALEKLETVEKVMVTL